MASTWGSEAHSAASLRHSGVDPELIPGLAAFTARMNRLACGPATARAFYRIMAESDVRATLPTVRVPTLLIDRASFDDRERAEAEDVAARIPQAKLLRLPAGPKSTLVDPEPIYAATRDLLGIERPRIGANAVLATVLFTDIVDSTRLQASLGDAGWRSLAERHHAAIRQHLAAFHGTEQDTAGDGFFARFDGPARAIRCALEATADVARLGIDDPRRGPHGRVRDRRWQVRRAHRLDRRPGDGAGGAIRGARVPDGQGPVRGQRVPFRRRGRARAEGRTRPLALVPRERLTPPSGLPASGRIAEDAGVEMREERRVITAVFADMAGSTALGERLDLEEYKLVMGEAVAHMVNAVEAFGGTVKDLAGDGVLALFGAPVTHEDDPERAILASLRIVEDIEGFSAEVERAWGVAGLAVRVGVETGPVVTGAVGAGSRVEYGATGDVVNTAARLQAAADPGTVVVGPATRSLVEPAFAWGPRREVALKGKELPLEVAAVTGVTGAQARVSVEATTPFVGRSAERAQGVEAVEATLAGSGRDRLHHRRAGDREDASHGRAPARVRGRNERPRWTAMARGALRQLRRVAAVRSVPRPAPLVARRPRRRPAAARARDAPWPPRPAVRGSCRVVAPLPRGPARSRSRTPTRPTGSPSSRPRRSGSARSRWSAH